MKVILDREDIEEAIIAYVRDKVLPYGDTRKIHVVQERKVSAKITFGDDVPAETIQPFTELIEDLDDAIEETLGA